MKETFSYKQSVPAEILDKYAFCKVRDASKAIMATCPNEWTEVMEFLKLFELKTSELMTPGGAKSRIVERLESMFHDHGWLETRIDTENIIYKVPKVTGQQAPIKLNNLDTETRLQIAQSNSMIEVLPTYQE